MWILWLEFTSHRTVTYLVLGASVKMTHSGMRGCLYNHQNIAVTTCGACGYGAMMDEPNCPPTLPWRKKTLQKRFSIISVVKDLCNNWWSFCGHRFILQPTNTNKMESHLQPICKYFISVYKSLHLHDIVEQQLFI